MAARPRCGHPAWLVRLLDRCGVERAVKDLVPHLAVGGDRDPQQWEKVNFPVAVVQAHGQHPYARTQLVRRRRGRSENTVTATDGQLPRSCIESVGKRGGPGFGIELTSKPRVP